MKLDLKWMIPIAVTVIIAIVGGATAIVAVPWKLDGRYEQKVLAAEKSKLLQEKLEERHRFYLEQIGGMSKAYLQAQLDNAQDRLFRLLVAQDRGNISDREKAEIRRLKARIKSLQKQIDRIR